MRTLRIIVLVVLLVACLGVLAIAHLGRSGPLTWPAIQCLSELKENATVFRGDGAQEWLQKNGIKISEDFSLPEAPHLYLISWPPAKRCSYLHSKLRVRIERPGNFKGIELVLSKISVQESLSPQDIYFGKLAEKSPGEMKPENEWFKFLGFEPSDGINYENWNY